MSKRHRWSTISLLPIVVALAIALAGCGASGGPDGGETSPEPGVFGTSEWGEATWQ